jgi:hypothetical protein
MEELSNKRSANWLGSRILGSGLNHPPEAKTQTFLYGANQKSACQFISILNSKRSNNMIKAKKQVGPSKFVLVSHSGRCDSIKYFQIVLNQIFCWSSSILLSLGIK